MRLVSARRRRQNAIRRRLLAVAREEWIGCEARLEGCQNTATDWHERLSRARGGSITDENNRVFLCRSCHIFITDHPRFSEENGWSLRAEKC